MSSVSRTQPYLLIINIAQSCLYKNICWLNCVRAMTSQNKSVKPTLSTKLARQNKVIRPKAIIVKEEPKTWDIEDLPGNAGSSRSHYFSPVQTRKQRQLNVESNESLPAKKARQALNKKDLKTTQINVGSATIIKCEIVPEFVPPAESHIITGLEKTEQDAPNDNWLQQLDNIRIMRAKKPAPVDTLGCHQCADSNANKQTQRFHKLVALMLSSQTKDETTFEAMKRLKAHILTPVSIKNMATAELEGLLHPVSFYKNKAKYLKKTAEILIEKYNEDIPDNIPELLKLPGVGPKMAHICMATAWNKVTGIGVDTHVHRIANRLAWLTKPTKEPEQTRIQLEKWLPRNLWAEVNHLFVGFGQTICMPVKPNCIECLNKHICPASTLTKKINLK